MDDYSALRQTYSGLALEREAYNHAVDREFCAVASAAGPRWLDAGAGDAKRTLALNTIVKKELTVVEPSLLLEPSFELDHPAVEVIRDSFEEIETETSFDLVSALWNVVGHVDSLPEFFGKVWDILAQDGVFLFDVNSPLNFRKFGLSAVSRNLLSSKAQTLSFNWNPTVPHSRVNFYRTSLIARHLSTAGFISTVKFIDYASGKPAFSGFTGSAIFTARKISQNTFRAAKKSVL